MLTTAEPPDLRELLAAVGDAVVVTDAAGAITLWNPAAERMFGHTEKEALGASLDMIIPQRLRGRHWDGWTRTMATGQTRYGGGQLLAVPATHRDGRTLSIEFSIQLLLDPAGQIEWVVAVIRDVTERFERDKALKLRLKALEGGAGGGGQPPARDEAAARPRPAAQPPFDRST